MKPEYKERFLRSLGILNEGQLLKIKNTSIAIAGLGLGGSVFIDLVRMGFEKFHIADPDVFERTNINRQRMAKETSIGQRKDHSAAAEARAINPDIKIKIFSEGVKPWNLREFLTGIDWVVDIVDVFALSDKLALHAEARERNIPVASCATLGFSGSVIMFNNTTPSFAELTGMSSKNSHEINLQNFLQFMAPYIPEYMCEQLFKAIDKSTYIPFVVPGGEISAAFATTEIVKNILNVGKINLAPTGVFVDSYNSCIELFEASHLARSLKPSEIKKKAA